MEFIAKYIKYLFFSILLSFAVSAVWAADPECIIPNDTIIFQCSPALVSLPVGCIDPDGDLVSGPDIVSVPAVGEIVGGNWEYTPTGSEVVNVTIRCEDALGGFCETPFAVTFVMNSPPNSPVCPPDSSHFACDITDPITIDGFFCTDPDNNIDSMIIVIGIDTMDLVGTSITFNPVTGENLLKFICIDSCGVKDSCETTISVSENSTPVVNFIPLQANDTLDLFLCADDFYEIFYEITDNDDNIKSEILSPESPGELNANLNRIHYLPVASGVYREIIVVTDSCDLVAEDTLYVNVTLNTAPAVSLGGDQSINLCEPEEICVTYTVTNNDPLDIITEELSSGHPTAVIDTANNQICFTPDETNLYTLEVKVTDNCGLSHIDDIIITLTLNEPPVADSSAPDEVFICGDTIITHKFTATDITFPALKWNSLTSGTAISSEGELLLTVDTSGTYIVTAEVADECEAKDTVSHVFNIIRNSSPVCLVRDTIIDLADPYVYIRVPVGCSDVDFESGVQSAPIIELYGQNIEGEIVTEAGNYFWEYYVLDDEALNVEIICTDSCGDFCVDTFNVIINVNDPPTFSIKRNGTTFLTTDTAYVRPDEELNLWITAEDEDANLDIVYTINTDLTKLNAIVTFDWSEEINYPDSISGILRVWPNETHIGSYQISFSGRDNYDVFVDTTIIIEVLPKTDLEFFLDPDSGNFTNFRENRETILYYRTEDLTHPSDLITISPVTLPTGAIFQSTPGNPTHATITWTPGFCDFDLFGSSVSVAIRAVNDSGNILISDGFDLQDAGNQKPEIVSSSLWTLTEEIPDTIIITRNDSDSECPGAPQPTYRILSFIENPNSSIIPVMSVSNDSAFISWGPIDGDRGDYILTVEVDDQLGAKDTMLINTTVLATSNKIPEFLSLYTDAVLRVNNPDGSITLTNGESDQFYFEITFEDRNVLDSLTITPDFRSLNNNNKTGWNWEVIVVDTNYSTGRFTWTPSDTDAAIYRLTFSVHDGNSASKLKIVNLNITDQSNSPPTIFCESGSYRVVENNTIAFDLWASDIDSDDTLFKYTSLPRPPIFGNGSITPYDILVDSATFSWTPDYCQAVNDSVEYNIYFTVTDNDSLSDDTTISIWVIDAGNELAQFGIPSWDSIATGGSQTPVALTMRATDRDCDRVKFSGFRTSIANTILFVIPVTSDSQFVDNELDLDIYLSPFAEGLFYATIYIESDHNSGNWILSDSIKLAIYVGDQVPPVGEFDPIIVSPCVVGTCSPVVARAEFNDLGSGLDSVYISYRQGNHITPSQTKVLLPDFNVQTFNVTDTIPAELLTIYGLELIYQSFDGADPPNSSCDTISLSYDYHYDYSPNNAPYGRVSNFIPPTLRTLFYNDFSAGSSELNKWVLFSIPGIIDSVYLRPDSLFRYDIANYAYNETNPGWRVYKRSLWETGDSNGKYEIVVLGEALENSQAYLYRRLDNQNINESNERLYIPHGRVSDLNEISFDNIINYNSKQVWRFIGNPFPFPIRMDSLLGPSNIYKSGINSIYAWSWEDQNWILLPATGQEAEFNVLQPYSGFICWPVSPGNAHLAIDPDWVYESTSIIPTAKNAEWEDLFTIRMSLSADKLTDNLQFGFKNDADQFAGWEDHFKFTSGFEKRFIKFGINNFNWTSNAGIYAGDYRPLPNEGEVWPLMIYSASIDDGAQVMISWNIDDQIESGYEAWLIDKYDDNQINMRNAASYTFKQVTDIEDERFEVITGSEYFLRNYIEQSSELIPLSFQLYQNYPNPFNPTTIIKFYLPNSGEVDLSVFNVLGQEVKQIFNGVLINGEHSFEWNGTDFNGHHTASGTYFYRLRTDQQTLTKKMILIR